MNVGIVSCLTAFTGLTLYEFSALLARFLHKDSEWRSSATWALCETLAARFKPPSWPRGSLELPEQVRADLEWLLEHTRGPRPEPVDIAAPDLLPAVVLRVVVGAGAAGSRSPPEMMMHLSVPMQEWPHLERSVFVSADAATASIWTRPTTRSL